MSQTSPYYLSKSQLRKPQQFGWLYETGVFGVGADNASFHAFGYI